MHGRWWLAPIACTAIASTPVSAQSVAEMLFDDFTHAVSDGVAVWISPFTGDARDYASAALILGGIGVSSLWDDQLAAWIRNHPHAGVLEAFKPFRELKHKPKLVDLGAGRSIDEASIAFYVAGLVTGSQGLRDAAVGCVAAEKGGALFRWATYSAVSRERPLFQEVIDGDTIRRVGHPYDIRWGSRDPWWDNSFFSGHGSNVLACVAFLNHRFELGWIEPVLWTIGLGVNFGRLADQRHWLSDSLAGAAFGIAVGRYVAVRSLHRKAERDREQRGEVAGQGGWLSEALSGLQVVPLDGAVALAWTRRF